jgi:hypothetical protein
MLVVLVALTAAVPRVDACQMGSGDPRQDLAKAFSESDEIFVARLENYAERAQEARSPLFLAIADFEVVEVLKGHPPMRGTLSGGVVWRAVPDMPIPPPPPPPSCGPWITSPDIEGKTALIFVSSHARAGQPQGLREVHPFSVRFSQHDPAHTQATLTFVRQLKSTDPRSTP